ncbi:MAG: serine/threonine-protein kinase [Thermoguttaceae bacterium]
MTEPVLCPQCGSEIPAGSPAGLCPKCLVLAGLESQSPVVAEPQPTQPSPPAQPTGFVPPTVEQLAARFPQLEILELLGKGGMGVVYKVRQKELDRLVAVQILPPEIGGDPAFAERFTREARALARLSHPNIVAVYDFGRTGDGLFYFVMEYVDGVNLRQAIQSGGVSPKEALAIVPQICDALQFAHDEGIVHRDIKPENILVDKRGRVKIADFGLAKLLGQGPGDVSLTATQQVMGTLRYMAPEQMEGAKAVDHRADIYSLGVVFYELLTGELPIGRSAPPSKRVQVDVRLDEIVLRALEQDPEQRYQHASEVKTDVEAMVNKSIGDDVKSEPLVALPRFFWLRAFGMLMLGWIAVAALWNYGLTGFVLGSIVMAAIAQELLLCQARRNPCWVEKWRAANAWTRFNVLGMIIPLAMSFMMLIGGMELRWNSSMLRADSPSCEGFESRYKGKEYQLIRRLDAFKEQVPAVEVVLEGYSGRFPREMDLAVAWNRIVAGSMLVFFCWQQATGVEAFSGWKLRRGGWRWALVGTGTILASGVCAYAALNVAILLSCSGVHTGTLVNNTVMVRATVTQAASALDRWAAENGYMGGSRCRWSLQTVPKGQLVARVEVSDVALPFDRWRMRSSDWELPEPDLAIQIVGSEKPVQSEVSIRSSNSVEVGSEKQKRWQGIVDSLSDAVSKAAEIDPTKPVEMPALKQTDMGSEWAGLCGVLAATLLWLCVRARRLKSAPSSFSCSGVRWSMKLLRLVAGITIGLLVAASLVAWYRHPSAVDVARQHCIEQGVAAEKLALHGYQASLMPVGAWKTVEFFVKGAKPPKKLVVELRQPVYFLPWQVVEFREEALW